MQVKFIEEQKESAFVATTFEKLPTLYFSSVNTLLSPLIVIICLFRLLIKQSFLLMTV